MTWRCGCGTNQVLKEGPGIDITGSGTPVNPAMIAAQVSREQGNVLQVGGDSGLYVPSGTAGSAPPGWASVDGLPSGPNAVLCGYRGCGRALSPDNLQRSFQRAVAYGLPMAHVDVRALWDGTLLATSANLVSDFASGAPWVNENPIARATGTRISTIPMDVCDTADVVPPVRPDVGWFGFLEPNQIGFPTIEQIFREVGNRIVLWLDINEAAGLPRDAAPLLLQLIQRYGVSKSVIVASVARGKLAAFTSAGIATALTIPDETFAEANPPAALLGEGITWMWTVKTLSDATIQGYTGSGVNGMVLGVSRHYERERMANLGVRGVMSDDPLYYSADPARYRRPDLSLSYGTKTVEIGHLTASTDNGRFNVQGNFLRDARGFYTAGRDGLSMPANADGAVYPNGFMSILAGNLCPITAPSYRVQFQVRFDTAPSTATRWLGVAACWLTDAAVRDDSAASEQGYLFVQEYGGTMRIFKKNAGPGAVTGTIADWGTPAVGAWIDLTLKVTPTELRLYRTADEANPSSHVVSTDTQFRGGYLSLCKAEAGGVPFEGSFQFVQVLIP